MPVQQRQIVDASGVALGTVTNPLQAVSAEPIYSTVGYHSLTVAGTAVGLDTTLVATLSDVGRVRFRLETAQLRFRVGGVDPTTAEGELLEVGEARIVEGAVDAASIRFIRTGGTSGVLKCHFEDVV